MSGEQGEEGTPREVPGGDEGTGRKDATAPVAGAALSPEIDFQALYERLPEKKRARFANRMLASQPEQIAAARHKRRERIRAWLTFLVLVGIIGEAAAAFYVASVTKTASWDEVKDWLTLSLAPLVAAASVAAAFWFPSREGE